MAKTKKVKWSVGTDEPSDLGDFESNDDIKNRVGSIPSKGIYRLVVRRLQVKPNKNGDDRIGIMLVIEQPGKGKEARWNGWVVWDGLNVTDQGSPFIKRFLQALGLTWKDFVSSTEQDDQDPPHIIKIGKVRFETSKKVYIRAMLRQKPADDYNDDEYVEVARYLPRANADAPEPDEQDEADERADDDRNLELREELAGLSDKKLTTRALTQDGAKPKKISKMDRDELIEYIVNSEGIPF